MRDSAYVFLSASIYPSWCARSGEVQSILAPTMTSGRRNVTFQGDPHTIHPRKPGAKHS